MSERAIPHVRKFLGQRLRALRKGRKLSQHRLAQQAGLSGKFLGEVERGDKSISIDSLYRVSVALGVPLALLTSVGTSPESVPPADAERVYALVLHPHRRANVQRAYEVLKTMLAEERPSKGVRSGATGPAGRPRRRDAGRGRRPEGRT